jgi:hypothetical protein
MASFKTIIKRLNYYLNQLLEEDDFLEQQNYHRQLRLYHNELLHTAGVVEGLEVTKDGSNKFKVSEGMAIDPQGRELIWTKETQSFNLTDTNTTVFVTIKYEEKESDPDGIITGKSRRITEEPKIEIKTTKPDSNDQEIVLLATITLDSSGNIVDDPDNSLQRKAGAKIPEKAITPSMLQSPREFITATAKDQEIISPPAGTNLEDWVIFVSLREMDIKKAEGAAFLREFKLVVSAEVQGDKWRINCFQEDSKDSEDSTKLSQGSVNYLLLKK